MNARQALKKAKAEIARQKHLCNTAIIHERATTDELNECLIRNKQWEDVFKDESAARRSMESQLSLEKERTMELERQASEWRGRAHKAEGYNAVAKDQADKAMRDWYESWYSVSFQPSGEVPQVKGKWNASGPIEEMIHELRKQHPEPAPIMVITSRCGEVSVETAEWWLETQKIMQEAYEAHDAYIKAGVCSACGACSLKEAESGKCRPQAIGDTGDYGCPGEELWHDQNEEENEEHQVTDEDD